MALQAPIQFRGLSDFQGYWRLSEFHWSSQEPTTVRVIVDGYANRASYDAGEEPVCQEPVAIEIPTSDAMNPKTLMLQQVANIIYPLLKQQVDRFSDAIDV